jgi:GNAT superfamily N-acetyltransferase
MDIPDLPPDITFSRLPHTAEAIDFAFEAKRAAMGPHIMRRWAWDEEFQRDLHQRHFDEKPFYQIRRCETPVGTLSFQVAADHVRFGEFYIFPGFQGQGLGSAILRHCLALADCLGLPTRLEHLHWNPVRSLYLRHCFTDAGQSDIHIRMEREAVVSSAAGHPSPELAMSPLRQ